MKNLLLCCFAVVVSACGIKAVTDHKDAVTTSEADSGSGNSVVAEDGSVTPTDDASVPVTDSSLPPVVQSCLDTCTSKHPVGVKLAADIDTCWNAHCKNQCELAGDPSGKVYGPDASVNDGGTCQTQVLTPFESCSECTVTFCCTPWDKAFTNDDALALNECTNACWGK